MYDRPSPRLPVRCITSIRPGYSTRERVRDRPRPVGRSVVHDQHAEPGVREHAADEQRQVVPLVVGRYDDEDVH